VAGKALVISGGGSLGSYEAGVISQFNRGDFDAVYGTSAGALNGVLLSYLGVAGMLARWKAINSINDIFQFNDLSIFRLPALYNNSPLKAMALEVLTAGSPTLPVTVAVTDLRQGTTVYSSSSSVVDAASRAAFATAVADSATIPGLACDVDNLDLVDGGIMVNLPMQRAIDDGYTDLVIVSPYPCQQGFEPVLNVVGGISGDLATAMRVLDLVYYTGVWSTVRALAPVCTSLVCYSPPLDNQLGSSLDFSPSTIARNLALGSAAVPVTIV